MTRSMPRVLILAANEITADFSTGITVTNLFRAWPETHLAQVCLIPSATHAHSLTARTVVLPGQGGLADVPVRWALRKVRALASKRGARSSRDEQRKLLEPATAARTGSFLDTLATLLEMGPAHIDRRTAAFVRQFQPDVIYSAMSGIRMMRVAQHLSRLTGAPVVPHILDDWPTTLYENNELGGRAKATMHGLLGSTLQNAPAVGLISEEMAAEYRGRYGVMGSPLMNCVDVLGSPKDPQEAGPVVRFAYVGGLHLGRAALLSRIANVIDETAGAELHVHAPQFDLDRHRHLFEPSPSVRYGPSLAAVEVASALAEADVLVHLESFDESTARYTRLSISTKIPQYLGAARPVLAVGPSSVASIQHLHKSGGAVIVDGAEGPGLEAAVRTLTGDPAARSKLSEAALAFAREHHDGKVVRARLVDLLTLSHRG